MRIREIAKLLIVFSSIVAHVCGPARGQTTTPPQQDAPRWNITELDRGYVPADQPLYWIDNDRVLFSAWRKGDRYWRNGYGARLYIWDLKNGVTDIGAYAGRYCYADSRIFRVTAVDQNGPRWRDLWDLVTGKYDQLGWFLIGLPIRSMNEFYGLRSTYLEGPLESPTEGERRFGTRSTLRFNDFSCRIQARPSYLPDTPHWQPLKDGDGYLAFLSSASRPDAQEMRWYLNGREARRFSLSLN